MQVEEFFDRHGGKTILFGRFSGSSRALAPFIAGASRMPFAALPPLRHHRRRPVGDHVLRARLRLLAELRPRRIDVSRARGRLRASSRVAFGVVVAVRRARPRGAGPPRAFPHAARQTEAQAARAPSRAAGAAPARCSAPAPRAAALGWQREPGDRGLE